jgi:hypothetical protein
VLLMIFVTRHRDHRSNADDNTVHIRNGAVKHLYEVRPRKDDRGVDLISDALPFGRLWYGEPNAIEYAQHRSRSHDAVIRVYDDGGNVIETREHKGDFKEW